MTQPSPPVPVSPQLSAPESRRPARTGLVTALISAAAAVTLPALLFLLLAVSSAASNAPHGYGLIFGSFFGLPFVAVAVGLAIAGLVVMAVDPNGTTRSRVVLRATGFAVIVVNSVLAAADMYMLFTK